MAADVHVFILWSRAEPHADRIVADLRQKFELLDARRVTWPTRRFAENLQRFYGFGLAESVDKAFESGSGPFLVYVVRDPAPSYEPRAHSSGMRPANVKAYDSKQLYREWAGGGFCVHATTDVAEAERDVALLFQRPLRSFVETPRVGWDAEPGTWAEEIVASKDWSRRERFIAGMRSSRRAIERRLSVRAPLLARLARRLLFRARLERPRNRATIRETSPRRGDESS